VTPLTHPLTTIDTPLPAPISDSLADCDSAPGSFNFTPHGMSFGETTQLLIEVGADGITGTRTLIVSIPQVETDSSPVATRTYSFDTDFEGWTITSGIYSRKAPGANGTAFHLSSSENVDNACDVIDSPSISWDPRRLDHDRHHEEPQPDSGLRPGIRPSAPNTRTTIIRPAAGSVRPATAHRQRVATRGQK
jgi:hypothetical protein